MMHASSGSPCRAAMVMVLVLGAACSTDPVQAPSTPASIAKISGSSSATLGDHLAEPVVVEVRDAAGEPMAGVTVAFAVSTTGAAIERAEAVTDAQGRAGTGWRLGLATGSQALRATLRDHADVSALVVTATATTAAVQSLSGGANLMCAVLGDGRLGCWIPPGNGDPAGPFRLAATAERFTSVAVGIRRQFAGAATMPGCATSVAGRLWCFEVSPADASIGTLAEKAGAYPAMAVVQTGTAPFFADPPFCALGTAGAVWCWGRNAEGVLGDGTTTDRAAPGPVSGGGVTGPSRSAGPTHAPWRWTTRRGAGGRTPSGRWAPRPRQSRRRPPSPGGARRSRRSWPFSRMPRAASGPLVVSPVGETRRSWVVRPLARRPRPLPSSALMGRWSRWRPAVRLGGATSSHRATPSQPPRSLSRSP